jgi:hypothetical protein
MSKAPLEAQIHAKLARFGVSGPGRDWLLRALHPASEKPSPGLPDESALPVLRPDFRQEATISAPESTSATWDCFIWTPPGDVNALYWATAPVTTGNVDFTSPSPPSGAATGVINLQSSQIITSLGPVEYQVPADPTTPLFALSQFPGLNPTGFRHQFKSVTVTQIASAVSDQGQVYAAQFPPLLQRVGDVIPSGYDSGIPISGSAPPNYLLHAAWYQCVLPAFEGDLCAMAPDFYQAASREGVYMPLRLAGPTQPFARSVSSITATVPFGRTAIAMGDPSGCPVGACLTPNSGQPTTSAFNVPWPFATTTVLGGVGGALPGGRYQFDSGYDNLNVGVMIFRGLSGQGGGGFGASLQIKLIAGLEITPNPTTGSRVFSLPAAPYEPRALEAYYTLCLELKGAYPSNYNSLESIWNAIKSAASKVWGFVEPVARSVVSAAAPIVLEAGQRALTSGLGGLMLTGARRGAPRRAGLHLTQAQSRAGSAARGKGSVRVSYRPVSVARSTSRATVRPRGAPRKRR